MLNIRSIGGLAGPIGFDKKRLIEITENVDGFCREFLLVDPKKPNKERIVLTTVGDLRLVQERILSRILAQKLSPSLYAHGGIRDRNVKSNLMAHVDSSFVLTLDISNFFPSINHHRIYRLFSGKLGCAPDVARALTRLCTFHSHLALGLVTSPFLAEQVLSRVDSRIAGACKDMGLVYSRYIDDIAISAAFDLEKSGLENLVAKILADHGFMFCAHKTTYGKLADGVPITGIRFRKGQPDVLQSYLAELDRQLEDVRRLAAGESFDGPYYTRAQISGRVQHAVWVNPRHRSVLLGKLRSIDWRSAEREAAIRGLVVAKKVLKAIAN